MTKKYGLHCFRCGCLIINREDVHRVNGYPYCGECGVNCYSRDRDIYEEEQFYKRFPTDQDFIDYKNLQKYGEY